MDPVGEREGGMNQESSSEIYTLPYVKQIANGKFCITQRAQPGEVRWGGSGREGTYVYLWMIYVDIWQKPTQHYKAIILQLKINIKKKPDQYCLRLWVLPQLGKIRLRFYTLKEILVSLIFLFNVINLFTQPAIPCHYFMRLNFHC